VNWLLTKPHLLFDTEATGVNPETDRIVAATTIYIDPGLPPAVLSRLIDPGVPIPSEATQVHGITTEHAQAYGEKPELALRDVACELDMAISMSIPIVACNAAYDLTILDRELRRHGLPVLDFTSACVVDVYVLDQHLDPYRKGSRRLTDLCETYGVRIDGAHNATFDAVAAGRVAWRMAIMTQWTDALLLSHFLHPSGRLRYGSRHDPQEIVDRFLGISTSTPAQLHAAQIGWRADQQRSLRAFFEKEHQPYNDVREAWPMIPYQEEVTSVGDSSSSLSSM
jgi:DNA polymerase III subunit epsilon